MKPWFQDILEAYSKELRSSQDSFLSKFSDKCMATQYSLNVANSVGSSTRAPILIPSEYHHWSKRMRNFLKRLGKEVWRSVEQGPHVPTLTVAQSSATEALGGTGATRPTAVDQAKMDADEVAFHELTCGVPPEMFDLIINCNSAKEIWDTLQMIFNGTESTVDKLRTSAMNDFQEFKALPGEKLDDSFKRFNMIITRLKNSGCVGKDNHEINLRFLNGLGKEWTTAKMIIQSGRKIKTLNIFQVFGELQAQESTVEKEIIETGGPLALMAESNHKAIQNQEDSEDEEMNESNDEAYIEALLCMSAQFGRMPPPGFIKKPFKYQNNRYPNNNNNNRFQNNRYPTNNFQKPHFTNYQSQESNHSQNQDQPKTKPLAITAAGEEQEEAEDNPIVCHKCQGLNHFARDCKAKTKTTKVKDKEYYLEKAKMCVEKGKACVEKGKACVAEVKRNVQVWSSGDSEEEEEFVNKRKRGKMCFSY